MTHKHVLAVELVVLCDDIASGLIVDTIIGTKTHKLSQWRARDYILCRNATKAAVSESLNFLATCSSYAEVYEHVQTWLTKPCNAMLMKHLDMLKCFSTYVQEYSALMIPTSGIRLAICNRYDGDVGYQGMTAYATRDWEKGEKIGCLVANFCLLTAQEEEKLIVPGENDFSITLNSKGDSQLTLGGGSFINHQCSSENVQMTLTSKGKQNLRATFEVKQKIHDGQEIFCNYGPEYFGKENEECQCVKCARLLRGAFKNLSPIEKGYTLRARNVPLAQNRDGSTKLRCSPIVENIVKKAKELGNVC